MEQLRLVPDAGRRHRRWRPAVVALAAAAVVGAGSFPNGGSVEDTSVKRSQEGRFVEGTHRAEAGVRRYRLWVPDGKPPSPEGSPERPLLVMLHGCTQDPEDFAAGTRMHLRAGAEGWLVLYPEQPASAHPQRCWNWYRPADQAAGSGEPAILAGMIEQVIEERDADRGRVRVAGISAGAGMALVLAALRPDLFAGVGLHSGVPYGAARSREEAMAVMAGDGPDHRELARRLHAVLPDTSAGFDRLPPLVVFHGTADEAVDPVNARRILESWHGASVLLGGTASADPPGLPEPAERRRGEDGRPFQHLRWPAAPGRGPVELWRVEGLGHAWSGGSAEGSYADPEGPSATREMVRFFRRTAGDGGTGKAEGTAGGGGTGEADGDAR